VRAGEVDHQLGPARQVQLAVDLRQVLLDRPRADAQPARDLPIGRRPRHQPGHLPFAGRQHLDRPAGDRPDRRPRLAGERLGQVRRQQVDQLAVASGEPGLGAAERQDAPRAVVDLDHAQQLVDRPARTVEVRVQRQPSQRGRHGEDPGERGRQQCRNGEESFPGEAFLPIAF
jgi:hypothetical protein